MELTEFINKGTITALFGFLGVLAKIIVDQKKNNKKQDELQSLITDKDKMQDAKLEEILAKLDKIEYRETLKSKIRVIIDRIITNNVISNTELLLLLNNAKDKCIYLVDIIIKQDLTEFNEVVLKNDMQSLAKNVWAMVDYTLLGVDPSFHKRLELEVAMPILNIFLMRFKDEVLEGDRRLNGTFARICETTIVSLFTQIISIYRECTIY